MKKHSFLCCNQETYTPLIWRQYGYWSYDKKRKRLYEPPEWFNAECLKRCEDLVKHLKEPDLQIKVEPSIEPEGSPWSGSWSAKYTIFDPNNPHIEPYECGVTGCKSEREAHAYTIQRYAELKRLYDGDVEALLVYKRTRVACLPNWNHNEIDSWGYKKLANGKVVKTRVPRAREVETT